MKNGLMVAGLASALAMVCTGVQASDGTINFTGTITDTACIMDIGASNKLAVDLGNVAKTSFSGVGSTSSATAFNIKVKSCPAAVTAATVKFDGINYSGDNTALSLDTPETGTAAVGVGVQLMDNANKVVALHNASSSYALKTGDNTLPFTASYIQKAASVTSGVANATAQFTLNYN